ncbi:GlxA family transcriptional regulator [Vogesella sp. DC21W]|uniref:GlxA family transcriptional regulator n=1 Tax=Vogesella aquatica TaxID=2984206 RepID=A0ABT5IV49_9NEIS|nr:GlxA family transcriptional regulator [Vogesella aquatica]MDC7716445.1 GlxA family transcriptional regulator [Vogesella aquatica]
MVNIAPHHKPVRFGFLLLPHASMADLAIATEVLTRANQLAERRAYEFLPLSLSGEMVTLSNGMRMPVDLPLAHAPKLDVLVVLADEVGIDVSADELGKAIGSQLSDHTQLVGIGCGSYWLARAGLLAGHRATIHWQEISRLTDEFPDVIVSSNLFELDGNRLTSAGGAATFDFMMALVAANLGQEFVATLSEVFSMERLRPGSERQRIPLATRIGGSQPKLTEAVSLMEANIEEPLTTDDIAYYVGVSRRQLERLFKQHLGTVPSKYYLELRLSRARQLLQQTSKSIVQIGLACGFSSGPHFSSTYRSHFGITPREERAQRSTPAA